MNNQEILDNAPEGATHINNCGFYLKAGKSGFMEPDNLSNDWDYEYSNHSEVSSLADIKRITDLHNQLQSLNVKHVIVKDLFRNADKAATDEIKKFRSTIDILLDEKAHYRQAIEIQRAKINELTGQK